MKKIVVFSDSHGNVDPMISAIRVEKPDLIIHLGDINPDAQELRKTFPDIPMEEVCGNCDYRTDISPERLFYYEGKKIFMTHGHKYHVKNGLLNLQYAADEKQADIVLFGHTHQALCEEWNRRYFMNPGSVGAPSMFSENSYGVIIIENGHIFMHIEYI